MKERIIVNLHPLQRRRLEKERKRTKDARYRVRLQVVLLYDEGWGAWRIAKAVGCAPSSAARIARRFLESGEAGLIDGRCESGVPKIDADQLQALAETVEGSPEDWGYERSTWTRELLAKVLHERTRVKVSVTTVGRMLKQLKARWGMPRPTLECPWSKHKKTRKINKIHKTIDHLPAGEVATYQDEVDIHLNPKIGRDWMLRRQQKEVLTPGRNVKHYVAGASNVNGEDLVWVAHERKNSMLFIHLLEALKEANPRARRIHLVLDNYIIHSSKTVQRYLASQQGLFDLHFLPPYSPVYNKIERLWRELHANVTRNHKCKSIQELMKKVHKFLRRQTQAGNLPKRHAA